MGPGIPTRPLPADPPPPAPLGARVTTGRPRLGAGYAQARDCDAGGVSPGTGRPLAKRYGTWTGGLRRALTVDSEGRSGEAVPPPEVWTTAGEPLVFREHRGDTAPCAE
jgi:hypothetical protein